MAEGGEEVRLAPPLKWQQRDPLPLPVPAPRGQRRAGSTTTQHQLQPPAVEALPASGSSSNVRIVNPRPGAQNSGAGPVVGQLQHAGQRQGGASAQSAGDASAQQARQQRQRQPSHSRLFPPLHSGRGSPARIGPAPQARQPGSERWSAFISPPDGEPQPAHRPAPQGPPHACGANTADGQPQLLPAQAPPAQRDALILAPQPLPGAALLLPGQPHQELQVHRRGQRGSRGRGSRIGGGRAEPAAGPGPGTAGAAPALAAPAAGMPVATGGTRQQGAAAAAEAQVHSNNAPPVHGQNRWSAFVLPADSGSQLPGSPSNRPLPPLRDGTTQHSAGQPGSTMQWGGQLAGTSQPRVQREEQTAGAGPATPPRQSSSGQRRYAPPPITSEPPPDLPSSDASAPAAAQVSGELAPAPAGLEAWGLAEGAAGAAPPVVSLERLADALASSALVDWADLLAPAGAAAAESAAVLAGGMRPEQAHQAQRRGAEPGHQLAAPASPRVQPSPGGSAGGVPGDAWGSGDAPAAVVPQQAQQGQRAQQEQHAQQAAQQVLGLDAGPVSGSAPDSWEELPSDAAQVAAPTQPLQQHPASPGVTPSLGSGYSQPGPQPVPQPAARIKQQPTQGQPAAAGDAALAQRSTQQPESAPSTSVGGATLAAAPGRPQRHRVQMRLLTSLPAAGASTQQRQLSTAPASWAAVAGANSGAAPDAQQAQQAWQAHEQQQQQQQQQQQEHPQSDGSVQLPACTAAQPLLPAAAAERGADSWQQLEALLQSIASAGEERPSQAISAAAGGHVSGRDAGGIEAWQLPWQDAQRVIGASAAPAASQRPEATPLLPAPQRCQPAGHPTQPGGLAPAAAAEAGGGAWGDDGEAAATAGSSVEAAEAVPDSWEALAVQAAAGSAASASANPQLAVQPGRTDTPCEDDAASAALVPHSGATQDGSSGSDSAGQGGEDSELQSLLHLLLPGLGTPGANQQAALPLQQHAPAWLAAASRAAGASPAARPMQRLAPAPLPLAAAAHAKAAELPPAPFGARGAALPAAAAAAADDPDECCMCLEREPAAICVPCGHQVLCGTCAGPYLAYCGQRGRGECPVCRCELMGCQLAGRRLLRYSAA